MASYTNADTTTNSYIYRATCSYNHYENRWNIYFNDELEVKAEPKVSQIPNFELEEFLR